MPLITAGFEGGLPLAGQPSITDLTPLAVRHFGVARPVRQAASALAVR